MAKDTKKIKGGQLASGDVVHLPRVGAVVLKRISALYQILGSVHFLCGDGVSRRFQIEKLYNVSEGITPDLDKSEIYRFDKTTGRNSVVSFASFCRGFSDVRENFKVLKSRISFTDEAVVLSEIENGAVYYTPEAIYYQNATRVVN